MDCLARREYGRSELRDRLHRRSSDEEAIERLLDNLERQGLLDEARFIDSYVRGRLRRCYGPRRIRTELRQRGIAEESVLDYLAGLDCDWQALAQQAWNKQFGAVAATASERARQQRFLDRRGFDGEIIAAVLSATGGGER